MTFLRLKRSASVTAVMGIATLSLVLGGVAGGQPLTVESFTDATVTDPTAWVAGGSGGSSTGWPGEACLTAGTDTSQNPIAGCNLGVPDAAGSGALRITPATTGRAGFALFNQALPSTGGLDITFKQAQWGGSGADGIAFFLVDGATNLTQPGQPGGALGYSTDGVNPGVANGLIGIGIDLWENFSSQGAGGSGCAAGTGVGSKGPGPTPNVVSIRGPGNGSVGYCWLGKSANLTSLGISISGASRAAAETTVRIVFDPLTVANRNVTVYLDGTQVVQVPAPQALIDVSTFKFGFGAATGDVTNNNEVWGLTIDSVVPVNPPAPVPVPVAPAFTG